MSQRKDNVLYPTPKFRILESTFDSARQTQRTVPSVIYMSSGALQLQSPESSDPPSTAIGHRNAGGLEVPATLAQRFPTLTKSKIEFWVHLRKH